MFFFYNDASRLFSNMFPFIKLKIDDQMQYMEVAYFELFYQAIKSNSYK